MGGSNGSKLCNTEMEMEMELEWKAKVDAVMKLRWVGRRGERAYDDDGGGRNPNKCGNKWVGGNARRVNQSRSFYSVRFYVSTFLRFYGVRGTRLTRDTD